MKKKLIAVIAAGTIAACTLCATGCNKNSEPAPSETFEGAVSVQSYASVNEAAENCIIKELSGEEYKVTFKSYEKSSDLTETEIEKLNIKLTAGETVESVEKGKAYFSEGAAASAYSAANDGNEVYITLYVIKYTAAGSSAAQYKYFIPLPETGESLSASYMNSVMDGEKYKNCTATCTSNVTVSLMGMTVPTTVKYDMALTETQVSMTYTINIMGQSDSMSIYLTQSGNTVKCATEMRGQYIQFDLQDIGLDIDNISELYSSQLTDGQCSMFIKTDYGYKMKNEVIGAFAHEILDSAFAGSGVSSGNITLGDSSCEFRVVEGRLYKATASFSGSSNVIIDGKSSVMSVTAKTDVIYSNFGMTKVTIPDAAKNLLGING